MSKERLEEIKKELELDWSDISYVVNQDDVKWLINRVEELEEENERLCALNIATTHELNHVDKINKRYREAVAEIENAWKFTKNYQEHIDVIQKIINELEGVE